MKIKNYLFIIFLIYLISSNQIKINNENFYEEIKKNKNLVLLIKNDYSYQSLEAKRTFQAIKDNFFILKTEIYFAEVFEKDVPKLISEYNIQDSPQVIFFFGDLLNYMNYYTTQWKTNLLKFFSIFFLIDDNYPLKYKNSNPYFREHIIYFCLGDNKSVLNDLRKFLKMKLLYQLYYVESENCKNFGLKENYLVFKKNGKINKYKYTNLGKFIKYLNNSSFNEINRFETKLIEEAFENKFIVLVIFLNTLNSEKFKTLKKININKNEKFAIFYNLGETPFEINYKKTMKISGIRKPLLYILTRKNKRYIYKYKFENIWNFFQIRTFMNEFLNGKIEKNYAKSVIEIFKEETNFIEINSDIKFFQNYQKDRFILFFSDSLNNNLEFNEFYFSSKYFLDNKNIIFFAMNCDLNDIPKISKIPNMYYLSKEGKKELFEKDFSFENLKKFIEKQINK